MRAHTAGSVRCLIMRVGKVENTHVSTACSCVGGHAAEGAYAAEGTRENDKQQVTRVGGSRTASGN